MAYMKRERAIAMNELGQCLEYPHTKVTSIYDIDKGDYLCTPRPLYFHHFIVAANYVKDGRRPKNGKQFEIIEFDGPQVTTKARVVAAQKSLNDYGELYKINYPYGETLDRDTVVERAKDDVGKENYRLFWNNCEHFANYCKTGKKTSIQVKNVARTAAGVSANVIKDQNVARTAAGVSANVIKDLVNFFLIEGTGKVINAGGVIGSGIIEVALSIDDIKRYYQMLLQSTLDEDEFVEVVLKRLLIALTSVAGAELGRILGFSVAGPVGLFLGGILGSMFGKLVGRAMGKAVVFYKDVVLELLGRYGGSYLYNTSGASSYFIKDILDKTEKVISTKVRPGRFTHDDVCLYYHVIQKQTRGSKRPLLGVSGGAASGGIAGAVLGGPVGMVVGGAIGGTIGGILGLLARK